MELSFFRIVIDFGLVVLIWMVQFLIYPSFLYFKEKELFEWHKKYTRGMFFIVMPLMVSQLAIAVAQLFLMVTLFSVIYGVVVCSLWMITFMWFVPLHSKIADGDNDATTLHKLVFRNWLRSLLWTGLFLYSLIQFIILR